MIRLVAMCRLNGDLSDASGARVGRVEAGSVFLADADNAERLIRRNQARPAPAPKPSKSSKPKKG